MKKEKLKITLGKKVIPSLVAGSGIVGSIVTQDPSFLIAIPASYGMYKMASDYYEREMAKKQKSKKLKKVI